MHQARILGIVGSYRKRGTIDLAVDEVLSAAASEGAEVEKIFLRDENIKFCNNCRSCTQTPGTARGRCAINDAMPDILNAIDRADGLVLGSPVNFGTATAIMKQFIERLVCYAHWPWGAAAPKLRAASKTKVAVLVVSSAAPSILARIAGGVVRLLRKAAGTVGARTTGVLYIGLSGGAELAELAESSKKRARKLGQKLVLDIGHHTSDFRKT